nr:MAG TPA: hypothetical protein [Caudoviricetes sp.]
MDGYSFAAWIACISSGWVGSAYIEKPLDKISRTWMVSKRWESSETAIACYALYVRQ